MQRSLNNIIDLKDINLQVKKGEFVVIIGEVASGKSTLLNAIIGEMVYLPQNQIDFIGDPSRKMSENELKALQHTLLQQDFSEEGS